MHNLNYINLIIFFIVSLSSAYVFLKIVYPNLEKFISIPKGPQKIHEGKIPRLGGISIFLTIIIISIIVFYQENEKINLFILYSIVSTPVFLIGFVEDITQSISPKLRLFGSILSGGLFIIIFDSLITRVDVDVINLILSYKLISILFTLLCIIFLTQAFNIIDGLNGLCLFSAIISLLMISIIAYEVKDIETFSFMISLIFILLGILFFNFPLGKIFIGDSGAYIIGLYVAMSSIILVEKNISISSFVIVQILIYPSYEILRSFVRRLLLDRKKILQPDKMHLHSILYTRNTFKYSSSTIKINAYTSLQIIFIQIINFIYLINFYNNKNMVIGGIIIFIIFYEIFYYKINFDIKSYKY